MGVSKMFVRAFQENKDLMGLRVEERDWYKSISSGAEYVILKSEGWVKKSQHMPVWLRKLVLAQHDYTVCGVVWYDLTDSQCF
jgi:hypothetical protein